MSFTVNHTPPSLEGRTGNVVADFLGCVAIFLCVKVVPNTVETHKHQRHIDTVKGHPVDFLHPTLLGPHRTGVGVGTIVEIVTDVNRTRFLYCLSGEGKRGTNKVGTQLVPSEVDVSYMVQIPVDTGCNGNGI